MEVLNKGDYLVSETGGGAGYGDPAERTKGDIERDFIAGFTRRYALRQDAAD